ncbi:LamG domain-containing protein [Flavobacteriaceae bacterium]|nr:LamG domain-containing protein [Flavobacteriaceae bacterium]
MSIITTVLTYITLHKPEFIFLLAFLIYIITVTTVFTKNPYDMITNTNSGLSIFLSMLGGFLIMMGYFFYERKTQLYENETDVNTLSFLGKTVTSIISIIFLIAALYFIFTLSANFSDFSGLFMYSINFLILIGIIALIMKFVGVSGGVPSEKQPSWFGLLVKLVTYLPCLFIDLANYIKYQYQITTKPIIIILFLEILLIGVYFAFSWIMDKIIVHNAIQLIKKPQKLSTENNLGTFQNLNFKDDKFQYKYAVSAWIYLDSFPPETNPNYDEFTSLLNIGNKPNIQFNVLKNQLKIITQTEGKNQKILYNSDDFRMQKWNHIVVNYDGQSMDIFMNNELVSTNPGTIPYNDNTQITSGSVNGLHGGICNVLYYNDNISRGKIDRLYNSVKYLNPPVI